MGEHVRLTATDRNRRCKETREGTLWLSAISSDTFMMGWRRRTTPGRTTWLMMSSLPMLATGCTRKAETPSSSHSRRFFMRWQTSRSSNSSSREPTPVRLSAMSMFRQKERRCTRMTPRSGRSWMKKSRHSPSISTSQSSRTLCEAREGLKSAQTGGIATFRLAHKGCRLVGESIGEAAAVVFHDIQRGHLIRREVTESRRLVAQRQVALQPLNLEAERDEVKAVAIGIRQQHIRVRVEADQP